VSSLEASTLGAMAECPSLVLGCQSQGGQGGNAGAARLRAGVSGASALFSLCSDTDHDASIAAAR